MYLRILVSASSTISDLRSHSSTSVGLQVAILVYVIILFHTMPLSHQVCNSALDFCTTVFVGHLGYYSFVSIQIFFPSYADEML
jgi:hypothetical protein